MKKILRAWNIIFVAGLVLAVLRFVFLLGASQYMGCIEALLSIPALFLVNVLIRGIKK